MPLIEIEASKRSMNRIGLFAGLLACWCRRYQRKHFIHKLVSSQSHISCIFMVVAVVFSIGAHSIKLLLWLKAILQFMEFSQFMSKLSVRIRLQVTKYNSVIYGSIKVYGISSGRQLIQNIRSFRHRLKMTSFLRFWVRLAWTNPDEFIIEAPLPKSSLFEINDFSKVPLHCSCPFFLNFKILR